MHFDVPKFVRSLGCDHGHDEESRNGRDIKIDILDNYIRTPEVFRVVSEKTGVPKGYRNPPRSLMGLLGPSGEEEGRPRGAACPLPPPPSPNWTRRGRRPPFLLPLPLPFPLLVGVGKRGVLLLLGGGLLLLARLQGPAGLPPCSFIYGGRGHL